MDKSQSLSLAEIQSAQVTLQALIPFVVFLVKEQVRILRLEPQEEVENVVRGSFDRVARNKQLTHSFPAQYFGVPVGSLGK